MIDINVDFSRGKWNPGDWLAFKSPRWEYTGSFDQRDDHITNHSPEGLSDEEIYRDHVTEIYASMIHPQRLSGTVTVSSTMSFDHLMAPLIVLTPELDKDGKGRYAYADHFEVVLYNEGLNVWHHYIKDGKPGWFLAAFVRAPFEAKKRYELKVKLQQGRLNPRMTVECNGVKFGFESPELPKEFYAGVTGCEGRNRFYDFKVRGSDEVFNPELDGEH